MLHPTNLKRNKILKRSRLDTKPLPIIFNLAPTVLGLCLTPFFFFHCSNYPIRAHKRSFIDLLFIDMRVHYKILAPKKPYMLYSGRATSGIVPAGSESLY
jgi:hypothetical protein